MVRHHRRRLGGRKAPTACLRIAREGDGRRRNGAENQGGPENLSHHALPRGPSGEPAYER
ncbi:hypothetical protein AKJ09_03078 [Labilithrix luteola]|uniref:Uncharacterized protein n=1 Tax=Labilithrix luteola TaxID=1391654 RepID=A0A0K1PTF4_9BACT|nr:hypothetical protein AKJ09_03078 [Labilithrix luteola]